MFRPPLHRMILDRIAARMRWSGLFDRALDVGCGAGLSTAALETLAKERLGIERETSMLQWVEKVAPGAAFAAASGEDLPVRTGSIDLITAAGSLNYLNLDRFFREAARTLTQSGFLVVYDFQPGASFRDSSRLSEWYCEFLRRYPFASDENWRALDPSILVSWKSGFHMQAQESFELSLALEAGFYTSYILTETNVAHAIRSGAAEQSIREWCGTSLRDVFANQSHDVIFPGYFAVMAAGVES